jgi:hypothetical protein
MISLLLLGLDHAQCKVIKGNDLFIHNLNFLSTQR